METASVYQPVAKGYNNLLERRCVRCEVFWNELGVLVLSPSSTSLAT